MFRTPVPRRRALLAPTALALTLGAAAPAVAWDDPEVIARGLDNPRGLDVAPGDRLYVAEAGRGGAGPCAPGPEGEVCLGATGAVTRIDLDTGRQLRVATGLPSLASPAGGNATGPHDVDFDADGGPGWMVTGLGFDPATRDGFGPLAAGFGRLYRFARTGQSEPFADLAAYEAEADPDAGRPGAEGPNSNPWSVASAGRGAVVSDAGGNDLVRVNRRGRVSTTSVLPFRFAANPFVPGGQVPMQPVPTGVVRARGGGFYVGELTGFPFPAGAARLYDVPRGGGEPEVLEAGFTHIVDVAAARDGRLYVLQIASRSLLGPPSPGALYEVEPDGTRRELAAGRLTAPTGLAIDDDGTLYISHQGLVAGAGEVLRLAH